MARSYEDCLNEAVTTEKISKATAKKLLGMIGDAEKEAASLGKAGPEAYTFALSKAAERMAEEVGRTKKSIGQEILATQLLMEAADKHKAGLMSGLEEVLGEARRGPGGGGVSLVREQRAAYGMGQSILTDFLEQIRSRNFGLTRDRVAPKATVQELYGKASGVAGASENAKAWQKFNDWWLQGMEEAGVHIRKLEDWRLPQQFNTFRVKMMGQEGFVARMTELWQSGELRLRDFKSTADDALLTPGKETWLREGVVKDDDRVRDILKTAYDNIATKGNASIDPGVPRDHTMADRYNRRRTFEWPTADSYLKFQDEFGNGSNNLSELFMRHFHQMTHDLGTAKTLTGNPDRVAKTLVDYGKLKGLSDGQADYLERLYFNASGKAGTVANVTFANTMQAVRSFLSGAQLSSAALASLSDFASMRSVAAWNGLSATKVIRNYISEIAGGADARRAAMQLGLANDTGLRGLRDHVDETLSENINKPGTLLRGEGLEAASAGLARVGGRAAEFTMRGTGLEYHSNAGRAATGKLFLAELADAAGKTLDQLPERLGGQLQAYGIDAGRWDILRTKAMSGEGLFMDPAYLGHSSAANAAERDAAFRLLGAVDAESRRAIPEGGVISKTILSGVSKPGTVVGEAVRSIQYKGFAIAMTVDHIWKAFDPIMGPKGFMARGQYLAALSVEATVLGALSYQLRNIASGKDPEAMDTYAFWLKAASLGGVGGMMGDQIKTMVQTQSAQDASRLLTPAGGLFVDTAALGPGNVGQSLRGEKTNFGREADTWLRKYALPRLWYTNLAVDRLMWDTLQRMWDPDAGGAFSRIEQRARKDSGTQFWWRPGQTEPLRPPNLEAVLGR